MGELSDLLHRLNLHPEKSKNERFRNADGVYLKLQNLAALRIKEGEPKGLRFSKTDRLVWERFSSDLGGVGALAKQIVLGADILKEEPERTIDEDFQAREGSILARVHRIRERNRGFRIRVVRRVTKLYGRVVCEACQESALSSDSVGHSMFEAHHLVPLFQVVVTTSRLKDFVLLCANCHRLIHAAMREDLQHYDLEGFRDWLRNHRSTGQE
ncbi:MAG TPA: HNH endonuclease [Thermoanaerobaculia bacterium]|nr:HNH endonuclease [Thermoanaerobaculia bacterium]